MTSHDQSNPIAEFGDRISLDGISDNYELHDIP